MTIFKIIKSSLGCLTIAIGVTGAGAQEVDSDVDFRGISTIRVTGSPMSIESIDCNINSTALVRQLASRFDSEGLSSSDSDETLAVVTTLSTREAEGPCSSAIMLGAYRRGSFFDSRAKWLRTGYFVVWQSGLLFSSDADSHPGLASDALDSLAEAMLTEWRRVNADPTAPGQ